MCKKLAAIQMSGSSINVIGKAWVPTKWLRLSASCSVAWVAACAMPGPHLPGNSFLNQAKPQLAERVMSELAAESGNHGCDSRVVMTHIIEQPSEIAIDRMERVSSVQWRERWTVDQCSGRSVFDLAFYAASDGGFSFSESPVGGDAYVNRVKVVQLDAR